MLTEEEVAFSEIIGDLVEQWGFKRHTGRIWSVLYLRSDPLNPSQLQDLLSLSAGSVNTLLSELQTWGVVRRIRVAGDRNFYYEAEIYIWKSIANVLRARELRIVEEAIGGLRALENRFAGSGRGKDASFKRKRIEHVRVAIDTVFSLANLLVGASPERFVRIGRLVSKLRSM